MAARAGQGAIGGGNGVENDGTITALTNGGLISGGVGGQGAKSARVGGAGVENAGR
jgi:hypothetical protein